MGVSGDDNEGMNDDELSLKRGEECVFSLKQLRVAFTVFFH